MKDFYNKCTSYDIENNNTYSISLPKCIDYTWNNYHAIIIIK